ncbi:hypothetical protein [Hyphomicrobium sp.]|uniref:hypothetical protein n=1 Tax=Hyphomicrobium sp. TaxID=82 RepID=UPI0025C6B652|nr:hypothetical protein [Hyphomicrobium sp.]MCC7253144.1 hypothetical protein [Hyphomicrobium sp.]
MPIYRMEVFGAPDDRLRERRNIQASDDAEAIRIATDIYDTLAARAALSGYVLYDGERVVHEGKK